jgi:hypothetical protein
MQKLMLVNPGASKKKRHNPKKKASHKKAKNPSQGLKSLASRFEKYLGMKKATHKKHAKKHRENPISKSKHSAKKHPKKSYAFRHGMKRRNPIGIGTVETALFGTAGAVATQGITSWVLKANNKGIVGYLGNLITAAALGFVLELTLGSKIGESVAAGGFIGTGIRFYGEKIAPRLTAASLGYYSLPAPGSMASPALPAGTLSRYTALPAPRPATITNQGGGRVVSAAGLSGTALSHKKMWDN